MSHAPLNNHELELLDSFLMSSRTPEETMDLEMLDGMLVAIAIGPEEVPEDEWLAQLFAGAVPEFEHAEEADEILALIRRHAAHVFAAFSDKARARVGDDPLYFPLILEDEGVDEKWQESLGGYWASGFRAGMLLRETPWQEALDDNDEFYQSVGKILALELGHDPDDENAKLSIAAREERLAELPWHVEDVMFYWLEKRVGKVETIRHAEAQPGRNDPCPCGSGKKFKKCHGA